MLLANPQAIEDGVNDCLLKWNLGDDLAAAGLSLSAPAGRTYFDLNGDLVTGVVANGFRDQAYERSEGGVWTRLGLAELGSSTLLAYLCPTKAQLSGGSGADVTNDPAYDGVGGFAKWLRFGTDRSTAQVAYQTMDSVAGTTYTISAVVEMEDGSAPVITTGGLSVGDLGLVIDSDLAVANVTVTRLGATNRYRCTATRTPTNTRSSNAGFVRYTTQSGKAFRVTGMQVEPLPIATSCINAVGTPLSRAGEAFTFSHPHGMPARGLSALLDCLDLGSGFFTTPSKVLLAIGNALPSLKTFVGPTGVSGIYFNAASASSQAFYSTAPVLGRRMVERTVVDPATGRATLGISINGAAEVIAVAPSGVTVDSTISGNTGAINGFGSQVGRVGIFRIRIASGVKSQAQLLAF